MTRILQRQGTGWPAVAGALLLLLAAAACTNGAAPTPAADREPSPTVDVPLTTPEPTQRAADVQPTGSAEGGDDGDDGDRDGPPPLTASASEGGETAEMGMGSYCWTAERGAGLCVDAIGIITQEDPLPVDEGETVRLTGDLAWGELTEIVVTAHEAGSDPMELDAGQLAWQPASDAIRLDASSDADGTSFVARLPPGVYVISAFVRVPQGDVSYGLLLEVD